jgi:hypothetical protein
MLDRVIGSAVDMPLNDLLSLDRSHPNWLLLDSNILKKVSYIKVIRLEAG